jgi:hypothetical protein
MLIFLVDPRDAHILLRGLNRILKELIKQVCLLGLREFSSTRLLEHRIILPSCVASSIEPATGIIGGWLEKVVSCNDVCALCNIGA